MPVHDMYCTNQTSLYYYCPGLSVHRLNLTTQMAPNFLAFGHVAVVNCWKIRSSSKTFASTVLPLQCPATTRPTTGCRAAPPGARRTFTAYYLQTKVVWFATVLFRST
jgi:hypothetical protein